MSGFPTPAARAAAEGNDCKLLPLSALSLECTGLVLSVLATFSLAVTILAVVVTARGFESPWAWKTYFLFSASFHVLSNTGQSTHCCDFMSSIICVITSNHLIWKVKSHLFSKFICAMRIIWGIKRV